MSQAKPVLVVIEGPVRSGGVLLRLVRLPDGSARVETWNGSQWVPGGGDLAELTFNPPATAEVLRRFGVPPVEKK